MLRWYAMINATVAWAVGGGGGGAWAERGWSVAWVRRMSQAAISGSGDLGKMFWKRLLQSSTW